jgi:carbonic anhydrase/acetyltransferase-like protein (isoleucine patch superfamily)
MKMNYRIYLFGVLAILLIVITLAANQSNNLTREERPAANEKPARSSGNIVIDPTAKVHPSVIMEGRIKVGPYTEIGPGTILTGNITIGHHTQVKCNVTIRGKVTIGNYTHIYDNVNIEGGRPANVGTVTSTKRDQAIIGDYCWVNHGAVMHVTQMEAGSAVGLSVACDYNTRIGKGAVLANGSATSVDQVIGANSFAQGVPAVVKKTELTDQDRRQIFGLLPTGWIKFSALNQEAYIKKSLGIKD